MISPKFRASRRSINLEISQHKTETRDRLDFVLLISCMMTK